MAVQVGKQKQHSQVGSRNLIVPSTTTAEQDSLGLFRGLAVALPVSLVLWALIIGGLVQACKVLL